MFQDIKKIIGKKNTNILKIFLFMNILMFFLETISILSIPLFVSSIVDTEVIINKINNLGFINFSELDKFSLIKFISILVISIFFLKNLTLLILNFYQGKFIEKIKTDTSNTLYQHYLNMPYLSHLNKDPSTLTRNVIVSTEGIYVFINHLMNFTRESIAILVILSLLIFTSPILSITLIIFFSILIVAYLKLVKPKIKIKSNFNNQLRKKITQLIFESFNSIKDLKVSMKEKYIQNFFNNNISQYEKNLFYFQFNEKLPKIFLELFSIIFVSLVALLFFSFTENFTSYLAQISLIVICIFRFIPAFNGVAVSSVYLKIAKPDLKNLRNEIEEVEKINQKKNFYRQDKSLDLLEENSQNNFLLIKNLNFNYNEKTSPIFDVNLKIDKGEIIGITGDSGAGKSTFFYLMLGLILPDKGNIFYNNKSIFDNLNEWRKKISYVSQNSFLLDGTIQKNIAFNYVEDEKIDQNKIDKALSTAELKSKVESLSGGLNAQVGHGGIKLSGGEKQRVAISRALYASPEIIFMDESTSALDVTTEKKIIQNIQKNYPHTTLLIIAHRKSTLEQCNRVFKLLNGKLNAQIK
tara:strand:+ start:1190 stop:2932 length:1743 start_codon:yes stop_codon:yes gene_type:complete